MHNTMQSRNVLGVYVKESNNSLHFPITGSTRNKNPFTNSISLFIQSLKIPRLKTHCQGNVVERTAFGTSNMQVSSTDDSVQGLDVNLDVKAGTNSKAYICLNRQCHCAGGSHKQSKLNNDQATTSWSEHLTHGRTGLV